MPEAPADQRFSFKVVRRTSSHLIERGPVLFDCSSVFPSAVGHGFPDEWHRILYIERCASNQGLLLATGVAVGTCRPRSTLLEDQNLIHTLIVNAISTTKQITAKDQVEPIRVLNIVVFHHASVQRGACHSLPNLRLVNFDQMPP